MAVICPGGGYLDCSPTEGECVALRFNNRNCHAAVLHYATAKSAPGHSHFPRPLEDLAEAICLIRRNARDWGVDPDRIVIVGFSAGAHLCAPLQQLLEPKAAAGQGFAPAAAAQCCDSGLSPGGRVHEPQRYAEEAAAGNRHGADNRRKKAPTPPPRLLADRRDCGIRLLRPNR